MPTNLKIDDDLLTEALSVGGLSTKRETVTLALQEYVERRRQQSALELAGTIDYDPEFDPKAQRKRA